MSGHTAPDGTLPPAGRVVPAATFRLPGSKSLSARGLMIAALWADRGHVLTLPGLSDSDDTRHLAQALGQARDLPQSPNRPVGSPPPVLDTGEGGTGMRFLAARLALTVDEPFLLTGQGKITQRPIGPLVDTLTQLGARIDYEGTPGCPPLLIHPREGLGPAYHHGSGEYRITLGPQVSSQFASALMMAAPLLGAPLRLTLDRRQLSAPYLAMTARLMRQAGFALIEPLPHEYQIDPTPSGPAPDTLPIEADWSAASYAYALAGITRVPLLLPHLPAPADSLQGDAHIAAIMATRGVETTPTSEGLLLTPSHIVEESEATPPDLPTIDFSDCPDLAQTVIVYISLTGRGLRATGLQTLYHKETDRIAALATELARLGRPLGAIPDGIGEVLVPHRGHELWHPSELPPPLSPLDAHGDHRMAMSLAPALYLAARAGVRLPMTGADTVSKSFPGFWDRCRELLGGTYWPV